MRLTLRGHQAVGGEISKNVSDGFEVTVRYFPTSEPLRRYFANIVYSEVIVHDASQVEDHLFPDWAILHFHTTPEMARDASPEARDGKGGMPCNFLVVGPRSRGIVYRTGTIRQWGITLHPLGWALLASSPADQFANCIADGKIDPVFARFRPLTATLFGPQADIAAELARIIAFCEQLSTIDDARARTITDIFITLIRPDLETVEELAQRAGISRRTLERLCRRAFGFTPKTLLRRQRFLRSLMQFSRDSSLKWIGAIDPHYHDQAQFVRDFREIMGTTPTEYDLHNKPIAAPLMRDRARYAEEMARRMRGEGDPRDYRTGF